jgi:hypothetical protein
MMSNRNVFISTLNTRSNLSNDIISNPITQKRILYICSSH